jgi:uncharacterized membrane protein YeiH
MVILSATGLPVTALEAVGTMAFAVSGAMAATRRRMDVFGVAVLGVIAAIGGGTLRDLLLSEPVSWPPGLRAPPRLDGCDHRSHKDS